MMETLKKAQLSPSVEEVCSSTNKVFISNSFFSPSESCPCCFTEKEPFPELGKPKSPQPPSPLESQQSTPLASPRSSVRELLRQAEALAVRVDASPLASPRPVAVGKISSPFLQNQQPCLASPRQKLLSPQLPPVETLESKLAKREKFFTRRKAFYFQRQLQETLSVYRDLYYPSPNSYCTVRVTDVDSNQSTVQILVRKRDQSEGDVATWDSLHCCRVARVEESSFCYEVKSKLIFQLRGKENFLCNYVSTFVTPGSDKNRFRLRSAAGTEDDLLAEEHILSIGKLIEEADGKLRTDLFENYLGSLSTCPESMLGKHDRFEQRNSPEMRHYIKKEQMVAQKSLVSDLFQHFQKE